MPGLVDRLNASEWRRGTVMLSSFLGSQALTQAITFMVGLIVVNRLSLDEYAYYTVALAVASSAGVVAHSGFSSSMLSEGARRRGDSIAFARLVASASSLRYRTALAGCLVAGPTVFWLLRSAGATVATSSVLAGFSALSLLQSVKVNLWTEVLALEYERAQQQLIPIKVALLRTIGLVGMALLWPSSLAILAVNNASLLVNGRLSRQVATKYVQVRVKPDRETSRIIMASFWQLLPSTTFFALQGQVFVGLLAVTGRTTVLAQIGALSRYTLLFGLVAAAVTSLCAPVLARTPSGEVVRRYLLMLSLGGALTGGVLVGSWLLSSILVTALGPPYRGLETELLIVMLGGAIGTGAAVLSGLNQARGWIRMLWLHVPVSVCWTAGLLLWVNPTTVRTAAVFSMLTPLSAVLTQLVPLALGLRGLRSPAVTAVPPPTRSIA